MLDIESVMFDLDGTLIDSVPPYLQLLASILETVGLPPAPRSLMAEFMTGGIGVFGKMIPDELSHRKEELIHECITTGRKIGKNMFRDEVNVFPGVGELFALLAQRQIPIGIVSSTERNNIERKFVPLARKGLIDAVDAVVAIEDAPKKKPAPDPLIECAHRLNVTAERCVYVGDSHVDIRAGNAAGMRTIGVLTGLDDYETLKKENPTMIVDQVGDLNQVFALA